LIFLHTREKKKKEGCVLASIPGHFRNGCCRPRGGGGRGGKNNSGGGTRFATGGLYRELTRHPYGGRRGEKKGGIGLQPGEGGLESGGKLPLRLKGGWPPRWPNFCRGQEKEKKEFIWSYNRRGEKRGEGEDVTVAQPVE